MVTDRVPGSTSGYGIRVANVIEGLLPVGDVHVCLIDSSFDGAELPDDGRYEITAVTASELPTWERRLERLWKIPNLRYAGEDDLRERVAAAVGSEEWDLIWFSRIRTYLLAADRLRGARVVDLDDLNDRLMTTLAADRITRTGLVGRAVSLVDRLNAGRWKRRYREVVAGGGHFVVTHEGDREHLGGSECAIVPNGYPPVPSASEPASSLNTLLFIGPLSYEPNRLAVEWLIDEVIDRIRIEVPDATLTLVGSNEGGRPVAEHHAVHHLGFVEHLDEVYAGTAVVVAPLRSGGGTRVKVLEAMARRRPIVSTRFAVEGLDLDPDTHVRIGETAEQFAQHCISLLTDPAEARRMASAANAFFLERHTAQHASDAVTALVSSLIDPFSSQSVETSDK